jgi:hypothetical protein
VHLGVDDQSGGVERVAEDLVERVVALDLFLRDVRR